MSPEQVRGKRGDHPSDVYSLGIVLYEMLTGESPFDTGSSHSTRLRQVDEEPPERPLAGLPKPVQAVVEKALRKAPERRYQSAGELADALEKAAGVAAADSLIRADTPRDRVIATIHTDQVFLSQRGQPSGAPLVPAVIDEEVSRVLVKDKDVCALQIYTFGGGRVVRDGYVIPASKWKGAQARELFFYILLHGPLTRDAIGVIFWPDAAAQKVTGSFHTAIRQIRTAVGAEAVVEEGREYRLGDITYWFDVEEFEALVIQARLLRSQDRRAEHLWKRAAALYRGDFLPEANRTWCVSRRETLRDMYVETLVGMGQCHAGRRELEEAIGWYRRALEVDGLREDVHRAIIRCYFEAGRRSEALAQYRRCEEMLEKELGIAPSAETVKLYEQIVGKRKD